MCSLIAHKKFWSSTKGPPAGANVMPQWRCEKDLNLTAIGEDRILGEWLESGASSWHRMTSGVESNRVSVIVVNWNGERFLKNCLGALSAQSYSNREIILVDNGSSDNSVCFTRENFPAVKMIALRENRGFTGGNAAGLKIAQGTYIALVNNDARVEKAWLENLIQPMLRDCTVGICASKLIFENTHTVNSAGDGLTTAGVGFQSRAGRESSELQPT